MNYQNNNLIEKVPGYNINPEEEIIQRADPLLLEIDDRKIVKILDKRIKDSKTFFEKEYNLFDRRKKNETYIFGRQVTLQEENGDLKDYESRYQDNALYEIEASLKPLAMSRLPDLIVTPAGDDPNKQKTADDISKIINSEIKNRQNRVAVGIAFKHLPVYFVGVIKCVWKPEKNDFVFEPVHPDYIEVDHTCQTNNADDMQWVAQTLPITVQECFIRFPKAKDELIKRLQTDGILPQTDTKDFAEKDLATMIKIKEVWFDWKDSGQDDKFKVISSVVWKYKEVVLDKMKNPNHDYEGEDKYYTYTDPSDENSKESLTFEMIRQASVMGVLPPNVSKETIYRNYFDCPRKPFYFFGHDQWRKMPYDETSRIEQNIRNQEALDEIGKRVVEKEKARIKHIWSKEGGLKPKDVERMDLDDPRQDILIEGDVNKVHTAIIPEQVTPAEFKSLDDIRNRMYALSGSNAIRGQLQTDVATSNQIAREADFTRADDLVEDTVNACYEWMAQWSLQMIKLRYTDAHFKKYLGKSGLVTYIKVRGDMIDDGMEVMTKASGTDKLKAKNMAMDMAKMNLTDPLTFYQDLGVSDPEGRTEKLLTLQNNPQEYLARYVLRLGDNLQQMGQALNGVSQPPEQPIIEQVQSPSPQDTSQMSVEPPPLPQAQEAVL